MAVYLCSILFIVPCPQMIIPPEPVTVRPDTTVTFSCLAWSYGGLVYRWDKNDSLTLPSNSSVFFQDKSFPADPSCFTTVYELKIVNAQVIDEGLYCCEASNDCGTNKECAWLEVDSKLYIQIFISMMVVCIWQTTCTYQYYMISKSIVFVNFNVHMHCISLACKGGGNGRAMELKLHLD